MKYLHHYLLIQQFLNVKTPRMHISDFKEGDTVIESGFSPQQTHVIKSKRHHKRRIGDVRRR